jgi:hypothetical protein
MLIELSLRIPTIEVTSKSRNFKAIPQTRLAITASGSTSVTLGIQGSDPAALAPTRLQTAIHSHHKLWFSANHSGKKYLFHPVTKSKKSK